jgi:hypothetical protein
VCKGGKGSFSRINLGITTANRCIFTSSSTLTLYSNEHAFAALKADGSITTWGDTSHGGANAPNAPTDKGYIKIYSTLNAFAALKANLEKVRHPMP